MAKDILLTEEEQAERIKEWWKRNGSSVVTGCVLGVALVIGVNFWRDSTNTAAEEASEIYTDLAVAQDTGDTQVDSLALAARLKNDYSGTPYASKAALIEAREYVEQGQLDDAAESLRWAMDNTDESGVIHAARIRLARIAIQQGRLDEADSLLAVDDFQGFDSQYYEVRGDLARTRGDVEAADMNYTLALENIGDDVGYSGILTIKKEALGIGEQ